MNRHRSLLGLVPALLLSACAYESQYVPPRDGRARPIFVDNRIELSRPGLPLSPECEAEIEQELARALKDPQSPQDAPSPPPLRPQYWAEVREDPGISSLLGEMSSPRVPVRVIYDPRLALPDSLLGSGQKPAEKPASLVQRFDRWIGVWGYGYFRYFDSRTDSALEALGRTLLDWTYIVPIVQLIWLLNPPGLWTSSAPMTDRVNIYNDLSRTPGSACAFMPEIE